MQERYVPVSIAMPESMMKNLDEISHHKTMSRSTVVRQMIMESLDYQEFIEQTGGNRARETSS